MNWDSTFIGPSKVPCCWPSTSHSLVRSEEQGAEGVELNVSEQKMIVSHSPFTSLLTS